MTLVQLEKAMDVTLKIMIVVACIVIPLLVYGLISLL